MGTLEKTRVGKNMGQNKAKLERTIITTSRLMDFCSEKELVAQTGHQKAAWPLVILKELLDNALDGCEDKSIAPVIDVEVSKNGIEVRDNGTGIPTRTVQRILDFSVRVSSREAYIAPDRGAQGNALKTLVMMPFVLSSGDKTGRTEITSKGIKHVIDVKVDAIRQEPVIDHQKAKINEFVRNGTSVRLFIPWCFVADAKARFLQIADDYTFLNPHLTLNMNWMGERHRTEAIDLDWVKWRPNEPTSAHWYEAEHLIRLIGAYIARDQDMGKDRTVREVVAEFRGLSSTAKQKMVLDATGLGRVNLSALEKDNTVDRGKIESLLTAMKKNTKPVKPSALGVIGKDNLAKKFEVNGCDMKSFDYCKIADESDEGLPFIIETAFGWFGENSTAPRRMVTGVNWSPGIINPFRELGTFGQSLDSILEQQRIGRQEPVVFLLHCAYPRVEYTDRGKSAVVIRGKEEDSNDDDDDYCEPETKAEKERAEMKVEEEGGEITDIKLSKEWQNESETFEAGATLTVTPADAARQLIADGIAEKCKADPMKVFDTYMKAVTTDDPRKAGKMLDAVFGDGLGELLGKGGIFDLHSMTGRRGNDS